MTSAKRRSGLGNGHYPFTRGQPADTVALAFTRAAR